MIMDLLMSHVIKSYDFHYFHGYACMHAGMEPNLPNYHWASIPLHDSSVAACDFRFLLINMMEFGTQFWYYFLIIASAGCAVEDFGTQFEVFGNTAHSLSICKVQDRHMSVFHATCIVQATPDTCINMTVFVSILEPRLSTDTSLWRQTSWPQKIIDNTKFCHETHRTNHPSITSTDLPLNDHIAIFSGHWTSPGNSSPDSTAYREVKANHRYPAGLSTSQHLVFEPTTHSHTILDNNGLHGDANNLTYIFLGASHLRYSFNFLVEKRFGEGPLKTAGRFHGDHNATNYQYIAAKRIIGIPDQLRSICESAQNATVLIIQTGAWDTCEASAKDLFLDETLGLGSFLQYLRGLLDDISSCPRLVHLVVLTSVPYPFCFHQHGHSDASNLEKISKCKSTRGHRDNSLIGAFNEKLLDTLISTSIRPGLFLSIVDTFSILLPRLVFGIDEVVCHNHYSCRDFDGAEMQSDAIYYHTEGGDAVNGMLVTALAHVS